METGIPPPGSEAQRTSREESPSDGRRPPSLVFIWHGAAAWFLPEMAKWLQRRVRTLTRAQGASFASQPSPPPPSPCLLIMPGAAIWGHSISQWLPHVSRSRASQTACNACMAQACPGGYGNTRLYFVFPSSLQKYVVGLYLFPVVAIPNYHIPWLLKTAGMYSVTTAEARSLESRCLQGR